MTTAALPGQARTVRRRTPTFPSRMAHYWDFSPWGGGSIRCGGHGPGAVVLNDRGTCADIQTGKVYYDERFDKARLAKLISIPNGKLSGTYKWTLDKVYRVVADMGTLVEIETDEPGVTASISRLHVANAS